MKPDKAPGYWPTRLLLVAAILMTAATVAVSLWAIHESEQMFGPRPTALGLPLDVVWAALAIGLALLGLARVILIFRGTREESPAWRYRDR